MQSIEWGFTILLVIAIIGLILSLLRWMLTPLDKKTIDKINKILRKK
ncbi:hypothetical protein HXA34_01075 [Salipaludibacillus agaradhaerens]|nr:hypothetical protein [Salipaludibacillus agaradhaerens]MCR6104878.1 hypothetical protein [Salipaludibacillus agaradhaerens]MCR6116925.1 hypothetical protein [Salipaludibacillus agaradhaerens]